MRNFFGVKKIISTAALIIFSMIFLTACGKGYTHLEKNDAMEMMKKNPDIIILDVRTQEEYEKKHIPGALLVPIEKLREGDFSALPDKNKTILIYCWTGRRAEDSAAILVENGYTNIYEFGGLVNWTGELEGSDADPN